MTFTLTMFAYDSRRTSLGRRKSENINKWAGQPSEDLPRFHATVSFFLYISFRLYLAYELCLSLCPPLSLPPPTHRHSHSLKLFPYCHPSSSYPDATQPYQTTTLHFPQRTTLPSLLIYCDKLISK